MKTALLIMAHGSRIPEANDAAREISRMVQERTGFEIVEVAFRELHEPNIQQGIDDCVARGAQRILMVPYFLFMGAHVLHDLPEEIEEARRRHPGLIMEMGRHLGVHPKLADVVAQRVEESLAEKGWRQ
ncbi:sirohydrochlorin chelatase [Trichlorobacter ammonificans]|uniref:Sirohydrochlorin ferrochelatase n=1 Tax=Trichlorobacter ammonificans TaxID=2916410 RepID=A0ABN8HHF6_9BACT|nr:CbiX/SirB N-terminal domain-containing protein [Trichlorobacter ammonificans]CAH2030285.1 Sirohydrochlorin ferrochelatase [Trichlorobacter ammonificans]